MQQTRLNDKGQAMDEVRYEDPLQSYLAEPALHQINKFRKKLKKSGVVKAGKRISSRVAIGRALWCGP